jgi:aromatic-L-amino-acid decarboxylase
MSSRWPLEPAGDEMRHMVDLAMERIVAHLESLPAQPASGARDGAALARSLRASMPESGRPLPEILEFLFARAIPCSFTTPGPGYLAYIPGGGLFHAAVADLIADAVNRYVGVFAAAPALAQLEANVLRWFAEIVGFPASAAGTLTSGGSLANFTAVVTARRSRLPEDFLRGTIYASRETHHSVAKAAMLAGFPPRSVRAIDVDGEFRMRPAALRRAIAADRAAGLEPFLVVGNAGTTNTGAVDPLRELAALCSEERLWLHVDAAYGGFFALTARGRLAMDGLELADSLVLDPHKALFLPYGTGAVLARDGAALRDAHRVDADYLPPPAEDDLPDFHAVSPELSRPFRGLRVWLPLQLLGAEPFRAALEEKLDLAQWLCQELRAEPDLEILAAPQLSLFAFRLHPAGCEGAALDDLNRRFLEAINRRGRVYLTATVLPQGFALRACVVSFRTHRDRVEAALEDIRGAAAECRAAPR